MRKRVIHYATRVWVENKNRFDTFVSTLCGLQIVTHKDIGPGWNTRATKHDSRVTCKTCKMTKR